MRFAHVMIRVNNLDESIEFYSTVLGMKLQDVVVNDEYQYTIAFLGYGDDRHKETCLELTYNWGKSSYEIGTAFGHLAIAVVDVYKACEEVSAKGGSVTRPAGPLKGKPDSIIAFIKDPNGYQIELVTQK
ncbi:MAG: lactoylglutathione lyase [Fusobacteria bacterium]|nr:lactoylglutathione lyase [Fusobacteriota bacterium]